jgi:hypothetical protein
MESTDMRPFASRALGQIQKSKAVIEEFQKRQDSIDCTINCVVRTFHVCRPKADWRACHRARPLARLRSSATKPRKMGMC